MELNGHALRSALRDGSSDEDVLALIARVWGARDDRYSDLRSEATTSLPKIEMFAIGG